MPAEHCMVMTTLASAQEARALAHAIVEAQLAACVQMTPVRSVYRFKGEVEESEELLLLVKTRAELYDDVEAFIAEHHSYDVPEILQVPVTTGLGTYLDWMDEVT